MMMNRRLIVCACNKPVKVLGSQAHSGCDVSGIHICDVIYVQKHSYITPDQNMKMTENKDLMASG